MGTVGDYLARMRSIGLRDGRSVLVDDTAPAPFDDTTEWWDGMVADGGLRSATAGREARIDWATTATFDPSQFVDVDWAALDGDWAALGRDATAASGSGLQGAADAGWQLSRRHAGARQRSGR
jgi:hypothetical protein